MKFKPPLCQHHPGRILFLLTALAALVTGLWGGLIRLAWEMPLPGVAAGWMLHHGPLMVGGFLGTLICLERAVGYGKRAAYVLPALSAIGTVCLLLNLSDLWGARLLLLASFGLVGLFGVLIRQQTTLFLMVMGLGGLCWAIGNVLWLQGFGIPQLVPWWMGFLLFTISGERLELNRVLPPQPIAKKLFLLASVLILIGISDLSFTGLTHGLLACFGFIAMTIWLFRYDVARRTVRIAGLTRFIAICLLSSYVWLGVTGLLMLRAAPLASGLAYDALLHAFFLGFVFAMIFGHAPVIFPALLGVTMRFRPAFYAHLVLLHASLLARIAGDLTGWEALRSWGGMANVIAILLFFANTILAITKRPQAPTRCPVMVKEAY